MEGLHIQVKQVSGRSYFNTDAIAIVRLSICSGADSEIDRPLPDHNRVQYERNFITYLSVYPHPSGPSRGLEVDILRNQ